MASLSKNFDFNLRRIIKKISYERRDFESVYRRKEPILSYVQKKKTMKKEFRMKRVKVEMW